MRFLFGFIFGVIAANIGLEPMARGIDKIIKVSTEKVKEVDIQREFVK
jgi:hypothetical protein